MRLSIDRISHIAHLFCEQPVQQGKMSVTDNGRILQKTKDIITAFCQIDEQVDQVVRKKLASHHNNPILEGSPEWDIMYKKYFEEELNKRW